VQGSQREEDCSRISARSSHRDLYEIMQGYVADFTGASKTSKSPPQDLQDLHARTSERISPGSPQDLLISGPAQDHSRIPYERFARSSQDLLISTCTDHARTSVSMSSGSARHLHLLTRTLTRPWPRSMKPLQERHRRTLQRTPKISLPGSKRSS
jgi:hypothetical protein